jgi:uncharacterized protein YrzB (UPF0473 family)
MEDKEQQIIFTTEDGEEVPFYVLEQTKLNGETYLLVADSNDKEVEANALILKENSLEDSTEAIYQVIEDETELEALSKIFVEILDDTDIKMN